MALTAAVHINHAAHQQQHGGAIAEGLWRHGINVEFAPANSPVACDFAVVWGWRQDRIKKAGPPVLVMERGHLQDRMAWTSVGWGGLGRRAVYADIDDGGERWRVNFGEHMRPWREPYGHPTIFGQVAGDASIHGVNFQKWASDWVGLAEEAFVGPVFYRPHPLSVRSGDKFCPPGAVMDTGPLDHTLDETGVAITYNSTVGVETVLAGVRTIACDEGSMAWPVSSRGECLVSPDRTEWAHKLAWTSFSMDEIRSGFAWECVRDCGAETMMTVN